MFVGELASGEAAFAEALDAARKVNRKDLEAFIRNNLAETVTYSYSYFWN